MVINLVSKSLLQIACRPNALGATATINGVLAATRYQRELEDCTNSKWSMINYTQNRGAARRGKRIQRAREARANATKRRLLEAQNPKSKKGSKANIKIDRTQFRFQDERERDLMLPEPPEDDVYFFEKFRKRRYALNELIELHRQVCHPDVLNQPDALVTATIGLNLKMKIKKKKYIERIESTVCYPHVFKYQVRPRKIVALCKDEAIQQAAKEAGASIAGGMDIVDQLKKKLLTERDFDHVVCHSDLLLDFANVKGMKGAPFFPNKSRGNFGDNIVELVKYFKDGIDYSLKRDSETPEFGFIECHFGKLSMTNEQLLDNLTTLFDSINRFKPNNLDNNKQFFERVSITTPANSETFLLKFWDIIEEYEDPLKLLEELEKELEEKSASN